MTQPPIHTQHPWAQPPDDLILQPSIVDIWRGQLDPPTPYLDQFWEVLSPDERTRAKRFKFAEHQNRFIAARGMLRHILGKYLHTPPPNLSFELGPHGKPFLPPVLNPLQLSFNVAHSHNLALYGVARHRDIGIDVEYERPDIDYPGMVSRIFSKEEAPLFWNLPQDQHQATFFSCWTQKEAYLKARGEGLIFPLNQVSVRVTWEQPSGFFHIQDAPEEASRWKFLELFPQQGYAGAIVASGQDWDFQFLEFSLKT